MNKIWLVLAPAVLQAALVSISEPSYWRYAHSDAKVLAGVEWKRMAKTPAGVALREMASSVDLPGLPAGELLDQIDRLLISSPGGANAKLNKQAPLLIIATGRFDLPKFRQLALKERATIRQYKYAEFIYPPAYNAADTIVALIDSQTILIGEKPVVAAAIDKARSVAGPLSAFNRLFARASVSAGQHDVWMIASVSPAEFYTAQGQQSPVLGDIVGVDMNMDFHDGLGLGVRLASNSEESAQGIAGVMKMMLSLAANQTGTQADADMQEMLGNLDIRTEASDVRVSMKINQAQLEKSIRQAVAVATRPKPPIDLGGFKQTPTRNPEPAQSASIRQVVPVEVSGLLSRPDYQPQAPPPPAPPAKKMVIRIEGLDGGIREIPYGQPTAN
jgi:hypothetical protein